MGQILVRNIDDAVLDALRGRARDRGLSLEEEVRQALTASVGLSRAEALKRVEHFQRKVGRVPGESSLEILRRDRLRDEVDLDT
jgi:plasmid stability protein